MPREEPTQPRKPGSDFEAFVLDIFRHMSIEAEGRGGFDGGLNFSLSSGYDGAKVLDYYVKKWGVERWTPLLLGKALVDLKARVGGAARLVAAGEDFLELYTTKCEFGEPRNGEHRGNLCGVCGSVSSSIARASGMTDQTRPNEIRGTLAAGDKGCDLVLALTHG